jgi:aerobic carbon-monoxide dehydrogenase medium subunit
VARGLRLCVRPGAPEESNRAVASQERRRVKPAPFEYHAPSSVAEALELLGRGDGAQVLAGGQSLVPLMKARAVRPAALVDVNGVAGLDAIEERDGALHIGALVRLQALVDHPGAARSHPLLRAAVRHAGHLATRHRGTVGGSLAYAAPWAELTAAAVALDATVELRAPSGPRSVPARSFFRGPHETALQPGELVTGLSVPARPPGAGAGFHEVSARYRDYAHVAAAATVAVDAAGACSAAELVLLRVAPAPHRVDVSGLVGTDLDDTALGALDAALAGLDPPGDVEVSGAHRRRVAPVLARRALRDAFARAGEHQEAA